MRPKPDIEYTTPITGRAHIRVEIGTTGGDVDWFLVQLEYNVRPHGGKEDDWQEVARFDHHPHEPHGHDIRIERLHLDIYKEDKKITKRGFPPVSVNDAPGRCEEYLKEHAEHYLSQFECWHEIPGRAVTD